MCRETGCGKVNIIAHSKGGLDARYAISKLGMAPYVASLTTMNTPHRGCRFVDYACGLPEGLYRLVASCFDRTFLRLGDRNPDFYTATHQFSTWESVFWWWMYGNGKRERQIDGQIELEFGDKAGTAA